VEAFVRKVLPKLKNLDTSVIVNVCGEDEEEYCRVVEFLNPRDGIAAFELNISCPNVRQGGDCPALDSGTTFRVVKAVKKISRLPLIVKLSPNVTSVAEIAAAAEEAGADAISLVNTFLAMSIDVETRRPKLANVFGGLSGPAIKPIALRMVYQVASRIKVPVIGIGGISSGADALEFLLAGARAIEVGTASFVDPDASLRVIREMVEFCERHGIQRVEDLIGKLET
jgi:dihydroorotate dehydrogenase (NAD+) catalytic subunit